MSIRDSLVQMARLWRRGDRSLNVAKKKIQIISCGKSGIFRIYQDLRAELGFLLGNRMGTAAPGAQGKLSEVFSQFPISYLPDLTNQLFSTFFLSSRECVSSDRIMVGEKKKLKVKHQNTAVQKKILAYQLISLLMQLKSALRQLNKLFSLDKTDSKDIYDIIILLQIYL